MNTNSSDPIEQINQARKKRGLGYILLAAMMLILVAVGFKAIQDANSAREDVRSIRAVGDERAVRLENLENALEAQRAQFEACKDKKSKSPGCEEAISPPANNIGPQGIPGLQGVPGPMGPIGPQGPQGLQGVPGVDGKDGDAGSTGSSGPAGSTGDTGQAGPIGPVGPTGPPGPKGEKGEKGDAGDRGPAGTDGQPGEPAYPFSFTFVVPGNGIGNQDRTYQITCTEAENDPCVIVEIT